MRTRWDRIQEKRTGDRQQATGNRQFRRQQLRFRKLAGRLSPVACRLLSLLLEVGLCVALAGCGLHPLGKAKDVAETNVHAPPSSGGIAAPSDGGTAIAPPTPPAAAPEPRPAKVKIVVRAVPKAQVSWGKLKLGPTPVTLMRPRDSGPVDLVVRADGYLPVHTRAYTFRNDALTVRLTKIDQKQSLLGAKREPPPEPPAAPSPDGGTAP